MYTFVIFEDGDFLVKKVFDTIIDGALWFAKTFRDRRCKVKIFEGDQLPAIFSQVEPAIAEAE